MSVCVCVCVWQSLWRATDGKQMRAGGIRVSLANGGFWLGSKQCNVTPGAKKHQPSGGVIKMIPVKLSASDHFGKTLPWCVRVWMWRWFMGRCKEYMCVCPCVCLHWLCATRVSAFRVFVFIIIISPLPHISVQRAATSHFCFHNVLLLFLSKLWN